MTRRYQALMVGSGAIVLLLGPSSGALRRFDVIGELTLGPLPGSRGAVVAAGAGARP